MTRPGNSLERYLASLDRCSTEPRTVLTRDAGPVESRIIPTRDVRRLRWAIQRVETGDYQAALVVLRALEAELEAAG